MREPLVIVKMVEMLQFKLCILVIALFKNLTYVFLCSLDQSSIETVLCFKTCLWHEIDLRPWYFCFNIFFIDYNGWFSSTLCPFALS